MKYWSDSIQVGDILKSPGGLLRIVRHISYLAEKNFRKNSHWERGVWIFFSIKRCSWTKACYTLYNAAELKNLGYRKTGKQVESLDTELDRAIRNDFGKAGYIRQLTCCSVKGVS